MKSNILDQSNFSADFSVIQKNISILEKKKETGSIENISNKSKNSKNSINELNENNSKVLGQNNADHRQYIYHNTNDANNKFSKSQ